jgi:hypothetical protein
VPFLIRWPDSAQASHQRFSEWERGAVIGGSYVVELRDVFPTFLDAAGALTSWPKEVPRDGDSLICLLGGKNGSDASTCMVFVFWNEMFHSRSGLGFPAFTSLEALLCG